MKGFFLYFIYALSFLVAHIYALDLNLSNKNDIYHLHTNMMIIVKKEKILVTWNSPVDDPHPDTFTLEILTNHTYDSVNDRHICAGSYVIADNITEYHHKWKAIKLQKYDMYTFLLRANGYDKFGLSHELYYAPSLYKFIKNRRGNSTFNIPYKYSSKDIKSMDVPVGSDPDNNSGIDSNEYIGDDGIRTTQRELKKTKFNAFVISTVVSTTMLVAFIILAVYSNQKNNKNKGEGSLFFFGKFKSSTCSISEEYVEEYSDCKSDTASSVMVREQLKRKALEIERKKMMDSINERSTNGSSNYSSEVMTNSGASNSDFSFHGMEVMTFSHQMKATNPPENQNKETKIEVDIVNITQPSMNDTDSESNTTSNNDFAQSTTINVNP